MKVKVIIDDRKKGKDEFPIKIRIAAKGEHTYIHTGYYTKKGTLNGVTVTKHPDKVEINNRISILLAGINKAYAEDQERTPENIKSAVIQWLKPESQVKDEDRKAQSFTAFVRLIISEIEQGKLKRTPSTLASFKGTAGHLEAYQKDISFNEIGREFYHGFQQHLKDKGNNANSIGKRIGHIKAFMNEAIERGLTDNREHQKKYFKAERIEPDTDYLRTDEIASLYEKKMPVNYLAEARDRFVLNCSLGLRISDFKRIDKACLSKISGKHFIRIVMIKTGKEVVIPVSKQALSILERYDYALPVISDQKNNEFIKEVCKVAGINKKVTNHTARRSFATNAFLAGVPKMSIMMVTGHKTEKAFNRYIRAEALESALAIMDHAFFR